MLVGRKISDITPEEFLKEHAKFSISMKYGQYEGQMQDTEEQKIEGLGRLKTTSGRESPSKIPTATVPKEDGKVL